MGRKSTVSVVIPTRNRGALLLAAVESALASPAAEVIVADGQSDDGSIELVEALGDRVVVLRGRYTNAAATRNAGAAAARGDYLAFLDSDDVMLPDKITCLVPSLDRDPRIVLAHGRTVVIDVDGNEDIHATGAQKATFAGAERHGTSYEALAAVCFMFTSATMMRRSAFEDVGGYDETLDVYEDWDLYLRLALRGVLAYENCVVAQYRVWPGNVRWDRTALGVVRVAEKHLASPPLELSAAANDEARYAFLRRLAQSHHILLNANATQRAAWDAFRMRPFGTLLDGGIRGPALRSVLPRHMLRRRRPPLGDR